MANDHTLSTVLCRAAGPQPVEVGPNRWPVPASVAHLCYPAAVLRSRHGLAPGDPCPCGAPVPDAYASACPACRRPYPTPCEACGEWVAPLDGGRLGWYEPPSECSDCTRSGERADRLASLRCLPSMARDAAGEYVKGVPARSECDAALRDWLGSGCGSEPGSRPMVWLSGGHRTGKSVAAVRAAMTAIESGRCSSVLWTTTRRIFEYAKGRYTRQPGEGSELIRLAAAAPLLLVEEAWGDSHGARRTRTPIHTETPNALGALSDILGDRAERRAPTIFTSLYPVSSVRMVLGASSWYRMEEITAAADLGDAPIAGG